MRSGDTVFINLPTGKVQAVYLGRGHFTKAYRVDSDVYCLTVDGEYMKEVLLGIDMPHVPRVEYIGDIPGNHPNVYRMPLYAKLTAKHKLALAQYRYLEKTHSELIRFHRNPLQPYYLTACKYNEQLCAAVTLDGRWPDLAAALERMASNAMNYGCGIAFEFPVRNLGVDADCRLVLRDILFDAEKIYKERLTAVRNRGMMVW